MNKAEKKILNKKLSIPLIVVLIGIIVIITSMFLPYISAQGKLAEYIDNNPDRIESKTLNLTAGDLKDVSIISVSKLITGAYGEDDGKIAEVIVLLFSGLVAVTTLFVLLKKPIAIIIFDLLAYGAFSFLNMAIQEDFIDPDKYAWGIGYHIILLATVAILASAVWMLVKKIVAKKEMKASAIVETETLVSE